MLCDSGSPEIVSQVTSILNGVFDSFVLQVKAEDSHTDGVDGNSGYPKYFLFLRT